MAICVECVYVIVYNVHGFDEARCNNNKQKTTDFVFGTRSCKLLNFQGNCKGFKPQSDNESIYELKKDDYRGPLLPEKEYKPIHKDEILMKRDEDIAKIHREAKDLCDDLELLKKRIYESKRDEELAKIDPKVVKSLAAKGITPHG